MNLTNLVLLSVSLATNRQSAVTARTNGLAQVSHVEQVQRLEVTAWRSGRRILSRQTNIVNLPPRRWSEVVPDLTPAPAQTTAAPVTKQPYSRPDLDAQVTNAMQRVIDEKKNLSKAIDEVHRPAGLNTNSPTFRRRAEMEARRAAAQATRTNATPPVTPAPTAPAVAPRTNAIPPATPVPVAPAVAARTNAPALK